MTTLYDHRPIDELAMKYVILLSERPSANSPTGKHDEWVHETYLIRETIYRRIGREHGATLIERSAEILKMVGL